MTKLKQLYHPLSTGFSIERVNWKSKRRPDVITTFYVQGWRKGTFKKEIWEFFSVEGRIDNIYISQRRNGEGKIFVFVRFKSRQEANKAVQRKNGEFYEGNKLMLNIARFTTAEVQEFRKKEDRGQSKDFRSKGIVGVMNEDVRQGEQMLWLISKKKREMEEIEAILKFLKVHWRKVRTKGKNCFLIKLEDIREKVKLLEAMEE